MYGKGLTLMKIWSQLDHFCKKLGDQKCENDKKTLFFLNLFSNKNPLKFQVIWATFTEVRGYKVFKRQ